MQLKPPEKIGKFYNVLENSIEINNTLAFKIIDNTITKSTFKLPNPFNTKTNRFLTYPSLENVFDYIEFLEDNTNLDSLVSLSNIINLPVENIDGFLNKEFWIRDAYNSLIQTVKIVIHDNSIKYIKKEISVSDANHYEAYNFYFYELNYFLPSILSYINKIYLGQIIDNHIAIGSYENNVILIPLNYDNIYYNTLPKDVLIPSDEEFEIIASNNIYVRFIRDGIYWTSDNNTFTFVNYNGVKTKPTSAMILPIKKVNIVSNKVCDFKKNENIFYPVKLGEVYLKNNNINVVFGYNNEYEMIVLTNNNKENKMTWELFSKFNNNIDYIINHLGVRYISFPDKSDFVFDILNKKFEPIKNLSNKNFLYYRLVNISKDFYSFIGKKINNEYKINNNYFNEIFIGFLNQMKINMIDVFISNIFDLAYFNHFIFKFYLDNPNILGWKIITENEMRLLIKNLNYLSNEYENRIFIKQNNIRRIPFYVLIDTGKYFVHILDDKYDISDSVPLNIKNIGTFLTRTIYI